MCSTIAVCTESIRWLFCFRLHFRGLSSSIITGKLFQPILHGSIAAFNHSGALGTAQLGLHELVSA